MASANVIPLTDSVRLIRYRDNDIIDDNKIDAATTHKLNNKMKLSKQ